MNNIKFKDLPKNELPRERFMKYGVENLSNEELLSIILKTGTKDIPVNAVSLEILSSIKDITKLKDMKINNLTSIKGVGHHRYGNWFSADKQGYLHWNQRQKAGRSPEL